MPAKPTEPRKSRAAGTTGAASPATVKARRPTPKPPLAEVPSSPPTPVALPETAILPPVDPTPVVSPVVPVSAPAAAEPESAASAVAAAPVPPVSEPAVAPAAVAAKPVEGVVAEPAASERKPVQRPALTLIANPFFQESRMATAFETTQETVKTTAEAAMNSGKAAMEQISAKSKEAVEAGMKSLDEMNDMARGNVEALMTAARAAVAGVEQIASHVAEVSRKSFEEMSNAARAMTAAKTPNELVQLQQDLSKAQFDAAVAEFSKMSEMMVKLAGEVMEPVQNRVAIATDKLKAGIVK